jgi:Ca2+-binding EF-hand superfamily protein
MSSQSKTPRYFKLELSEDQKSDLREAFDLFDFESVGEINVSELLIAFRALGYEPDKAELTRIVQERDPQNTGKINFNTFLDIFSMKMSQAPSEEEIYKAYKVRCVSLSLL